MFIATLLTNSPQGEKLKWSSVDEQNVVYPNNENLATKRAIKILKSPFFLNTPEGFLSTVIEIKRQNWKLLSENCTCGRLQFEKHFWSAVRRYPLHCRPLGTHFCRCCPVQELFIISPVRSSSVARRLSLASVLLCANCLLSILKYIITVIY